MKKSISQMNKTELKAACDAQSIPYPDDVKNKELKSLLVQAKAKTREDTRFLGSSQEVPTIPTRQRLLLGEEDGKVTVKINVEPDETSLEGRVDGEWEFLCTVTPKGGNVRVRKGYCDAFRLMRGDTELETVNVD